MTHSITVEVLFSNNAAKVVIFFHFWDVIRVFVQKLQYFYDFWGEFSASETNCERLMDMRKISEKCYALSEKLRIFVPETIKR